MAMTKKQIKSHLEQLDFRVLPAGHLIKIMGKKMYWQQVYKAPGQVGYAWNPCYTIVEAYSVEGRQGMFNANFNNKAEMIDWIFNNQNNFC